MNVNINSCLQVFFFTEILKYYCYSVYSKFRIKLAVTFRICLQCFVLLLSDLCSLILTEALRLGDFDMLPSNKKKKKEKMQIKNLTVSISVTIYILIPDLK